MEFDRVSIAIESGKCCGLSEKSILRDESLFEYPIRAIKQGPDYFRSLRKAVRYGLGEQNLEGLPEGF
jgi:hypothetical protein